MLLPPCLFLLKYHFLATVEIGCRISCFFGPIQTPWGLLFLHQAEGSIHSIKSSSLTQPCLPPNIPTLTTRQVSPTHNVPSKNWGSQATFPMILLRKRLLCKGEKAKLRAQKDLVAQLVEDDASALAQAHPRTALQSALVVSLPLSRFPWRVAWAVWPMKWKLQLPCGGCLAQIKKGLWQSSLCGWREFKESN